MASRDVVLLSIDSGRDGLPSNALRLAAMGRRLADQRGGQLRWLVLGDLPAQLAALAGSYGVVAVDHADDDSLGGWAGDAQVNAAADYLGDRQGALLIAAQTFDSRCVVPRIAARLGCGVVMNVVDLNSDDDGLSLTAAAYGGDTRSGYRFEGDATAVVALGDNVVDAGPAGSQGEAPLEIVSLDCGEPERVSVVERAVTEGPRIEDAEVIVAGGRGLQDAANLGLVEELAAALGGVVGASRPIVDDGWIERSQQVGLTGSITRPRLYIAVGISGASQHMVGCTSAKTLVAINIDPDAAVFRQCRYGLVGDCLELLPAITRAIKES